MRQASRTCSSVAPGLEKATFSRMVPANRNESWSTTPSCVRYEPSRTVDRSAPSTVTRPAPGAWNAETSPMIVLLPDPDEPTSAVTVPAGETNDTSSSTGLSASYAKSTCSNATSPRTVPSVAVRFGSASSRDSSSTSRVRSRPASASVSWVPMFTIWKIGAMRKPSSML